MSTVACLGDCCLDVYVEPVGRVLVGGSCLNVAVGLRRRGAESVYAGPVGDDAAGRSACSSLLAEHGLGRCHVRRVEGARTAVTDILLEPRWRAPLPARGLRHPGGIRAERGGLGLARPRGQVHSSRMPATSTACARSARRASASPTTSRPTRCPSGSTASTSHSSRTRRSAGAIRGEAARDLVARGAACAVVTLGERGAIAATADRSEQVAAVPVANVVDTCGAGDAFMAAFLAERLAGAPLRACLAAGAGDGAAACLHLGAIEQAGFRAGGLRVTAAMPLLRATGLVKTFGAVRALDGADFELYPGEIHALVGDNGAGKSTLIKVFSGVHVPDAGTIEIDGREVHLATPREAQEAGIETVYQDLALAGSLDAAENVFLGREVFRPGLAGRLRFVDRPRCDGAWSASSTCSAPTSPRSQPRRDDRAGLAAGRGGRARGNLGPARADPRRAGRRSRAAADRQRPRAHGPRASRARAGSDLHLAHAPHVFEVADRVSVMRRGPRALSAHRASHDARDHRRDGNRRPRPPASARMSTALPARIARGLVERESAFLLLLLAGICVAFTLLTPSGTFLSTLNATNVALDTAEILVLAAGMTYIIIAAGIDLSIGSLVVFSLGRVRRADDEDHGHRRCLGDNPKHLGVAIGVGVAASLAAGLGWASSTAT